MFEELSQLPPETEKPLGEVLQDLDAILGSSPDPERAKTVKRTDVSNEVSALKAEASDISDTLHAGNDDPNVIEQARHIQQALLEAQVDEISTRDNPSGNQ